MNLDTIFNQLRIWESRHEILVACDQKCANLLGGMISYFVLHSVNHLHHDHTPSNHHMILYHTIPTSWQIALALIMILQEFSQLGASTPACTATARSQFGVRRVCGGWAPSALPSPSGIPIRRGHEAPWAAGLQEGNG